MVHQSWYVLGYNDIYIYVCILWIHIIYILYTYYIHIIYINSIVYYIIYPWIHKITYIPWICSGIKDDDLWCPSRRKKDTGGLGQWDRFKVPLIMAGAFFRSDTKGSLVNSPTFYGRWECGNMMEYGWSQPSSVDLKTGICSPWLFFGMQRSSPRKPYLYHEKGPNPWNRGS